MNRKTMSLSQHYKDYKKANPYKRTIEELNQHFENCATAGDVEDVIYGGPDYHLIELIGDFTFDDFDEEGFATCPATGQKYQLKDGNVTEVK